MRFRDFLRVSVLLFGGAASALAVVSVVGAADEETNTLVYVAAVWWCLASLAGLWLGRRSAAPGMASLLASARRSNTLPQLEPGTVLFNRLWALIVLAPASAVIGFFVPQVPAIATGYCLLIALWWRNQSRAVEAIEGRDGVEFWLDKSSPFGGPKLLRLPGLRKIEPS